MKKNFKLDLANPKDITDIASLLSWAFGFSKARSKEYIANIGLETLRLIRGEDGRPVVCAGLLQTAHIFHGKPVQAANIVHVAIAPERRGQGLAVPFVDALCDEAKSNGAAIATILMVV